MVFSLFGDYMSGFFAEFLPGFTATVFGVILGFPVALYVNFRLTRFQRGQEILFERERRSDLANVIVKSLSYNEKILGRMAELCLAVEVMRNPDLQLTTWEAVGQSFSKVCNDPDILQLVSHHWLRLQKLDKMNKEIFDRSVGDICELKDEQMIVAMWGELFQMSSNLQCHSLELLGRLKMYSES